MIIHENPKYRFSITPDGIPNSGIMFADLQKSNRGGHFGHAMIEYAPGKLLAFYPNCNTDNNGHSGRGWMDYKRSTDCGITWSEGKPLAYSKQLYDLNIGFTSINEKAVLADDGKIILFNLICDVSKSALWEPYVAPTYITSTDGGETWSRAVRFTGLHGRVYDVLKKDGKIYVLFEAVYNADAAQNGYRLFVSDDNGARFYERSRLPFRTDRYYGNLEWLADGRMVAYAYCQDNEYYIETATSSDMGRSWSDVGTVYFEKRMRNPQVVRFYESYFCFGRSGQSGENAGNIIMYCSDDGLHWDTGAYLSMRTAGIGAYSNTLVAEVPGEDRKRLIYQSSHAYYLNQTNVLMWMIDAEEK